MASRSVKLHHNVDMDDDILSAPINCRHAQRVSFQNDYDSATPDGDFTYEVSNDPDAGRNPTSAAWTTVTPSSTHGAQPGGSAAGTFAVCFTDNFLFIRQRWTHVAGDAGDLLNTWVSVDDVAG